MPDHFVCLTFDYDNASASIAREQTTPTVLSRGDVWRGGSRAAAGRLLAERSASPRTWFIPGHTIETYPASCRSIVEAGHEIAHHGWTHWVPASLGALRRRSAS